MTKSEWLKLLNATKHKDKKDCIAGALERAGIRTLSKLYNATALLGASVCGVDTVLVVAELLGAVASKTVTAIKKPASEPASEKPKPKTRRVKKPKEKQDDKP